MLTALKSLLVGAALVGAAACNTTSTGQASGTCGNRVVEAGEQCDLGALNADDGMCKTDCTLARCGDGAIGPDEECDEGEANADMANVCRTNCKVPACGDGIVDSGEECDQGPENSMAPDACRPDCQAAHCGDGVEDSDETCDLGFLNSLAPDAVCRTDCTLKRCGDGVPDTIEECDDGAGNGNTSDACRPDCTLPTCGDGVVDSGEECDDGAANSMTPDACRPDCQLAHCGDGVVDSSEECDDQGESATCNANCAFAHCGDGIVNHAAGEACDQLSFVTNGWCAMGCKIECASEFGNCDGNDLDGCEAAVTTDPLNCGTCGHDCGGGTCITGKCQPVQLADLPESTTARIVYAGGKLAVGAPLTDSGGEILGGGTVLVPPDARGIGSATISNAVGYGAAWTVAGGYMVGLLWYPGLALPYVFGRTSLSTGITEEIVPLSASTAFVSSVSDGTSIYWAAQDRGPNPYQDAIWQYAFGDATPALVADYRPTQGGIASFNNTVGNGVAVFTVAAAPSEIWRVALPPAAPSPLCIVTPTVAVRAAAASTAWFVFATAAGISKIPAACTDPMSCVASDVVAIGGKILSPLSIDDTHVYWVEHTTAVLTAPGLETAPIKRVSLTTGVIETLVPTATNAGDILEVGDFIYWVERASPPATGRLWKLAKPLP
jgi:cysteine-rich repeat protein